MTRKLFSKDILRFLIPSTFGVLVFLTPIFIDGKPTIVLGIIFDLLRATLEDYLPAIVTALLMLSGFFSAYYSLIRRGVESNSRNRIEKIFTTEVSWLAIRLLGAIFACLVYFNVGPEWIISPSTGGTVLFELASSLVIFFLVACLLLPFLIDFGVAEFMGTLLKKPFLLAFRLPGRASIDSLASWLGSGSVGVLITIKQQEKGNYSGREAAIITTNFSIASIGIFSWALIQGVNKAKTAPKLRFLLKDALINLMDIWFSLLPSVVAIGTTVLILAEFTPFFEVITKPLVPVLELMQIPEAKLAAPAFLVGFADLYLPAVIGKSIESEMTRFIIACVSITQIIYMTEVGTLILKSKIPLQIGELFLIFVLRTAITLPIITAIAHLIYR